MSSAIRASAWLRCKYGSDVMNPDQDSSTGSSHIACIKCDAGSPSFYCVIAGMRFIKTTGIFAKTRHYERTTVETPLCESCAGQLRRLLILQRACVLLGGAAIGAYLTYRLQRYLDPLWRFRMTWDSLLDSLIPFVIAATISGALLVVVLYHLVEQPWLRRTGIYAWLYETGRATGGGVRIRRGPRRR